MTYTGFNIPEQEIEKMVANLDCSIIDACELWLADNGDIENEEQEELDKKAKKSGRHYEKGDKARQKTTRERKVDEDKAVLLDIFENTILTTAEVMGNTEFLGRKTETELYFTHNGNEYTLKLTKHRKKK